MNTSADAADQIVRMSLNGAEIALKVTGSGAHKAAKLIIKAVSSAMKETNRTKGSIRLVNLARSGKKLDVVEVADKDLKKFCTEAKKYGILYTILKDRSSKDGKTEIMYKSEDKEKFDRIFGNLNVSTVDMAKVENEASKNIHGQNPPERNSAEVDPDKFIEELMRESDPAPEEGHKVHPSQARTANRNQSEPSSKKKKTVSRDSTDGRSELEGRRSVRRELDEIRDDMKKHNVSGKSRTVKKDTPVIEHVAPPKKKKSKAR